MNTSATVRTVRTVELRRNTLHQDTSIVSHHVFYSITSRPFYTYRPYSYIPWA